MPKPPPTWPSNSCTRGGIAAQHAGDAVAIPVRDLGGAVKLQHVVGGVVAGDRAAGLERNAGMAPDREIELDHGMRLAKRRGDIAVGLFHDRRLGRAAVLEFPGRGSGIEDDRQFLDLDGNEIGCILRQIGIGREHRRDRLADIAHALPGQDRLAIGRQALDAGQAEVDRRNVRHVGRRSRPQRTPGSASAALVSIDRIRPWAWADRTTRICTMRGKATSAANRPLPVTKRPILQTGHGSSDEVHVRTCPRAEAARSAARMRCGVAGNSSIDTPNGDRASLMALTTAAGGPIAPPSPSPLALVRELPSTFPDGGSRWAESRAPSAAGSPPGLP